MRKRIILERLNGEVEQDADTDHIKTRPFFISYRGAFFKQTARIRDGANVYAEYRTPKDPILTVLMEMVPATTDSTDTAHPSCAT